MTKVKNTPYKKEYEFNRQIGVNDGGDKYYFQNAGYDSYNNNFSLKYIIIVSPHTEDDLRKAARETDATEYYDQNAVDSKYFDKEAFSDDQEEEWEENSDIAFEEERNGETIYFCEEDITNPYNLFFENSYEELKEMFEELYITKKEYEQLTTLLKRFQQLEIEDEEKRETKRTSPTNEIITHLKLMEQWNKNKQLPNKTIEEINKRILIESI